MHTQRSVGTFQINLIETRHACATAAALCLRQGGRGVVHLVHGGSAFTLAVLHNVLLHTDTAIHGDVDRGLAFEFAFLWFALKRAAGVVSEF